MRSVIRFRCRVHLLPRTCSYLFYMGVNNTILICVHVSLFLFCSEGAFCIHTWAHTNKCGLKQTAADFRDFGYIRLVPIQFLFSLFLFRREFKLRTSNFHFSSSSWSGLILLFGIISDSLGTQKSENGSKWNAKRHYHNSFQCANLVFLSW